MVIKTGEGFISNLVGAAKAEKVKKATEADEKKAKEAREAKEAKEEKDKKNLFPLSLLSPLSPLLNTGLPHLNEYFGIHDQINLAASELGRGDHLFVIPAHHELFELGAGGYPLEILGV